MTTKQYRTAMGKTVDMGALMLQNEGVRAVGNMAVNARGDKLDSENKVIDPKAQQIKRQGKKQSNVSNVPMKRQAKNQAEQIMPEVNVDPTDTFSDLPQDDPVDTPEAPVLQGGLAAAIAKAKTVQQTKLTPPRQAAKAGGVRKI